MSNASLLLLLAVVLPPRTLDVLGPVVEERTVETRFGTVGPLALRRSPEGADVWVQPYSGLLAHRSAGDVAGGQDAGRTACPQLGRRGGRQPSYAADSLPW
ncbi:MAG: hypothetical protein R2873_33755 [Caldilineaceae bacterium]